MPGSDATPNVPPDAEPVTAPSTEELAALEADLAALEADLADLEASDPGSDA